MDVDREKLYKEALEASHKDAITAEAEVRRITTALGECSVQERPALLRELSRASSLAAACWDVHLSTEAMKP